MEIRRRNFGGFELRDCFGAKNSGKNRANTQIWPPAGRVRMQKHRVDAGPDSVHWGFFDAALKPLITIESGDEVTMSTVSGPREAMPKPESGLTVPPALSAIHATVPQKLNGPHIMTGPVAVRGAKAGQVLEVRIKSIELHYDWGYNVIRPLAGALPDDFDKARLIHIPP